MTNRRKLVKELIQAGFVSRGGSNHQVFTKPGYWTTVPRHREIPEWTAEKIRKQAGLK